MTPYVDAVTGTARAGGVSAFAVLFATSILFALMVASANWVGAAAIVGGAAGLALLLSGPRTLFGFWLVGSPTFFVFLNNYLHVVPVLTMERVLFALLVAMVIVRTAWRKRGAAPADAAERWMLTFLGVGLVLLVPVFLRKSVGEFVSRDVGLYVQAYLMPMGAYMLARRLEWGPRSITRLGIGLLLAGIVLCSTAFLQVFAGVTAFVPTYMMVIHSEDRATGVFNNATEFGMVMNALLLLGLMSFARARDGPVRLLALFYAAAMLAAVILSTTRATWVGLLASLLVVYVADRRLRPLLGLVTGFGCVAAIVALPFLLESEAFLKRVGDVEPILNRIAGAATALNIIAHHPLFGAGFERGAFGQNMYEHVTGFGLVSAHWATTLGVPHNEHLNVAILTGLAGFIPYVAMYAALFAVLRNARQRAPRQSLAPDLAVYATAMLVSYLTNGFFVDFGSNIYVGILTFAALGFTSHLLHDTSSGARQDGTARIVPRSRPSSRRRVTLASPR